MPKSAKQIWTRQRLSELNFNIFVGAIYLFDDKFRIILNGSEKPIEIDDVLIDEVNDYFDGLNQAQSECAHLVADAPPKRETPL